MTIKIFGLCLLLTLVPVVAAEVGKSDLQRIYKLVNDGEYQQALEAHQHFFEQSRSSPGMTGVRLSFALSHWAELGSVYPPAQKALENIAQAHKKLLLAGNGSFNIMAEYSAINRYLDKSTDTVDVFLQIDEKYPDQAKRLFFSVEDELIDAESYEIIGKYWGDSIYEFEKIRNNREHTLSRIRQNPTGYNSQAEADARYQYQLKRLLTVTRALGLNDEAREIERRAAQYLSNDSPH